MGSLDELSKVAGSQDNEERPSKALEALPGRETTEGDHRDTAGHIQKESELYWCRNEVQ